jgi:diguanylate cyclase (GGDEF)-like protein
LPAHTSWSSHQLTEFLAAITRASDEDAAVRAAVECAAEALECEIGALVSAESVVASVGFAAGRAPLRELVEAAKGERRELELPGVGVVGVVSAPLDASESAQLLLARSGAVEFRPEEVILLRGMARILGMTLTMMRNVASLRERQLMFEQTAAIQRAITRRAPLQEVLDLITEAAAELLGDEVVGLRMVDPDDPTRTRTVAACGVHADLMREIEHGVVGEGAGGRAIAEGRLVVVEKYQAMPEALTNFVEWGLQSAMAAPIHDEGQVVGSLVVASFEPRTYTRAQQEMLAAFAQHASLALLDARTVDELLRQALHDPLTSLANRALFIDRLEHALSRCERTNVPLAVLFIDLDRFKAINDSLGHDGGDQVLLEVSRRLQRAGRRSDTVARFGGDEFAILIEDVLEQSAAAKYAAEIVERLREPFVVGGDEVLLTASIGIALASRQTDNPLRDADLAMYRAKSGGRDRFEFFEAEMRAAMRERIDLETKLKHAIDRDEFVLHYQPIFDLASKEINGFEALVRWQHPDRGLLPPSAFIELTEETGVMFALGRWVLREACRSASLWQPGRASAARPFVSVNLAPMQLGQLDLVREIGDILTETGLHPRRLALEITETSLLNDSAAVQRLRALKELGVYLALDDFGTGYSSLSYLQELPLDALKIPKVFVDQLGAGSGNPALALAIIDLGRTFGLDVIAEGIEREDQLTHLRALGCKTGQGYLLSPPCDIEATERLLEDQPLRPTARPRLQRTA